MFKKTNLSKKYNRNENNEQCYCNDNNITYRIIENYRSILDRKQKLISSWKILDQNEKVSFTHGTKYRKGTDALAIRSNHICLINPWYKYINVNQHFSSILKQNQCFKVFEIVLLESNCLTNSCEYEFAIIECPCLEQLSTYCTYCRLTLTVTEQSNRLLKDANQQTNISFSLEFFNDEKNINDSFLSQSGPYQHQCTVQIQVESDEVLHAISEYETNLLATKKQPSLMSQTFDECSSQSQDVTESNEDFLFNENIFKELTKYKSQEVQTKLFAILLPQNPLSEMKPAKIVERTFMNVTRTCQVNTLSYLIKTNENQIDLQHSNEDILSVQQIDRCTKSSIEMQHKTLTDRKYDEHEDNVLTIQFEEGALLDDFEDEKLISTLMNEEMLFIEEQSKEFNLISSTLKCVNACDTIDLDEPNVSITSPSFDDSTISMRISSDQRDEKYCQPIDTIDLEDIDTEHKKDIKLFNNSNIHIIKKSNNNSKQLISVYCQTSKLFRLKTNYFRLISRKRRRYRNKKQAYGFLRRLHRRKIQNTVPLFSSSSNHHNQFEYNLPSTKISTSLNRQQPSIIHLDLNNCDTNPQYKAYEHTVIVRTLKNSTICKQLQTLLNDHDTLLGELIDSQLILTCNNNCKSVCILIDDHKQSEQYRSSFLHYIYTTLSNTLKKIIHNQSIQITCMNLAFFNNSLCDIINMQRLRLIDTGRKIFLLPSCENSLKTFDDINIAINHLSTNMSFAHQIFIINFYHEELSISSSFFFLQLAPICSIRPTGLLTNLNSTTYSVLNLIRQLNNGQLFNHNTTKQYLLNDCSLNRLLKSYLFSPEQTITVIKVKPKQQRK